MIKLLSKTELFIRTGSHWLCRGSEKTLAIEMNKKYQGFLRVKVTSGCKRQTALAIAMIASRGR